VSVLADLAGSATVRSILALLAAGLVAAAGLRTQALARSGALAAVMVGTVLVGTGGWWTGVLIVVFFATSSALSRLSRETQPRIQAAKGERRDAAQVLANGGIPMLLALASAVSGDPAPWLMAAAGAIAAACADTWATEIGRTSNHSPRMITTWRSAPSGSSGAISTRGTLGALMGAGTIALTAVSGMSLGWWLPGIQIGVVGSAVLVAGFTGAVIDSVLGATIQAQYWCPQCQVLTEQATHRCGTATTLQRGLRLVTNDIVNALAVTATAALAWVWFAYGCLYVS
jgi:uncharacterized protein (TIGR00297 family)